MRVLILGNSGSGKSTLARELGDAHGVEVLDLDTITWSSPGVRRTLEQSEAALLEFIDTHKWWVIEGCYGSLIERALPFCTELVFLDPGVEACLANNRRRPWEPHKYPSKEAQDENLDFLQDWVREYYTRDDEYSHRKHMAAYERFEGNKRRVTG